MQTSVSYYRVSTQKQGQSELGLDAQRSSVFRFVKDHTLLVSEFVTSDRARMTNGLN